MRGDEKRENWLLIKEKDDEALSNGAAGNFLEQEATSISTRRSMDEIAVDVSPEEETKAPGKAISKLMADYPEVELATLVDAPPEGEQWLHELKFDGYRLLAFLADGEVRLRTRNGNDWTRKFPSLYASVAKLNASQKYLKFQDPVCSIMCRIG